MTDTVKFAGISRTAPPKYFVQAVSPAVGGVLFIDYDIMLGCEHAKTFGNDYYCNCAERIKFYRQDIILMSWDILPHQENLFIDFNFVLLS